MFQVENPELYAKEREKLMENNWVTKRVKFYAGLNEVAAERSVKQEAVAGRVAHMETLIEGYYNQIKNLQDTIANAQRFIEGLEGELDAINLPFDERIASLRKTLKIDEIPQELIPRTI